MDDDVMMDVPCSLVPPTISAFPCYQGSVKDATFCYNTDPLLPSGTTSTCDTCASIGYTYYLRNDPIYTSMGLWAATQTKDNENVNGNVTKSL